MLVVDVSGFWDEILNLVFIFLSQVNEDVTLQCEECNKKYKTKGGLERHSKAKHQQQVSEEGQAESAAPPVHKFSSEEYCQIVTEAARCLSSDHCLLLEDQQIFNLYSFDLETADSKTGYDLTCKLMKALEERSNAEKFYRNYYAQVVIKSALYFPGLPSQCAVLLSTKVADSLLSFYKHQQSKDEKSADVQITEKEKFAMQYLGGYVLFNLNKKFHHPRLFSRTESQYFIAILQAGRSEEGSEQKLIDTVNRGGLWKVSGTVQEILLAAETQFKKSTSRIMEKKQIDLPAMVATLVRDVHTVSLFQNWIISADVTISQDIARDLLEKILYLYLRVRAFSCTKDIVNRYRLKNKKKKALRTELKKMQKDSVE